MSLSGDLVGGAVGLLITVFVLSYAVGDNALFRIATHVFVGASAGYAAALAWWQVLWPDLVAPFLNGSPEERAPLAIPLLLAVLIVMNLWPRLSRLGSPATAFLVGTAAAVAVAGALTGTIVPQMTATLASFDPFTSQPARVGDIESLARAGLVLLGTVTSLAYFHFGARAAPDGSMRRPAVVRGLAAIGGIFIAAALGVLFEGVFAASLAALIDRISFIVQFIGTHTF